MTREWYLSGFSARYFASAACASSSVRTWTDAPTGASDCNLVRSRRTAVSASAAENRSDRIALTSVISHVGVTRYLTSTRSESCCAANAGVQSINTTKVRNIDV